MNKYTDKQQRRHHTHTRMQTRLHKTTQPRQTASSKAKTPSESTQAHVVSVSEQEVYMQIKAKTQNNTDTWMELLRLNRLISGF